jgi:uncharacterized protein DUF4259
MGTWGTRIFENDDAMDWVQQLQETEGTTLLIESFDVLNDLANDDYAELPECYKAIAAAEIVAALRGHPTPELPEEVRAWVITNHRAATKRLVQKALKSIGRVQTNSELKDLWDETDQLSPWQTTLADLANRLRQ